MKTDYPTGVCATAHYMRQADIEKGQQSTKKESRSSGAKTNRTNENRTLIVRPELCSSPSLKPGELGLRVVRNERRKGWFYPIRVEIRVYAVQCTYRPRRLAALGTWDGPASVNGDGGG